MELIKKLVILAYLLLMISVGAVLVSAAIEAITPEMASSALRSVGQTPALQMTLYALGGIFLLIGVIGPLRMAASLRRGNTIAFQNPDGEVTVSLKAIEDYIKKISKDIPGICDVRSHVEVTRSGVDITCYVSLTAGSNIPDITERIQLAVRSRLQSMLGMEEKINIKMHVSRIVKGSRSETMPLERELGPAEIPFR